MKTVIETGQSQRYEPSSKFFQLKNYFEFLPVCEKNSIGKINRKK